MAVVVLLVGSAQAQAFPSAEINAWTRDVMVWHRDFAQWYSDVMGTPVFRAKLVLSSGTLPEQVALGRRLADEASELMLRGYALAEALMAFQGHTVYDRMALSGVNRVIPRVNALSRAVMPLSATSSSEGMSALEFELRADLVTVWLQLAALSDEAYR